jgi:hypothetical protein
MNVLRFSPAIASLPRVAPTRDLVIVASGAIGPRETPVTVAVQNLARLSQGLGIELQTVAAGVLRLPPIPVQPPVPTLQQLISRARAALLNAQQTARNTEITTIQKSVADLTTGLTAAPAPISPA